MASCGKRAAGRVLHERGHGHHVRRVAAIMGGQNGDTDPEGRAWFLAFRKALKDLGWEEGHNFYIEYR